MSEDYEITTYWKNWHLTERGWMPGTFKGHYDETETIVAAPVGTLKTVLVTRSGSVMRGQLCKVRTILEQTGKKRLITSLENQFGNETTLSA